MSFVEVFGGTVVYPSDVSYLALALTADTTLEWPMQANPGPNVVARVIDVTPTGAYSITMPPADETGPGQLIQWINRGSSTITVKDNDGGTLLTITDGQSWYLLLTDNSDAAGLWYSVQYGSVTSQAQAAALAGYGLTAIGSMLAQSMPITEFSTSTILTSVSRAGFYVWTGAIGTITLPAAAATGVGANWFVAIRNSGTGNLVITPAGADLINDDTTLTLTPGDSAFVGSNGTVDWWTVGFGQDATFAFDTTTINLAGLSGTYTLSGSELNRISYRFTGALAGNIEVVVPSTTQQYWVWNDTTGGSYTLGVRTSTQTPALTVVRDARAIYYSNGTDVILADTGGIVTPIAVTDGGTGATTARGACINLGGTATGIAVFTAANATTGRTALSAAASGANSDITSLSGLTTPLTVAQGGIGKATATSGALQKGAGTSALADAVAGTDYVSPGGPNTYTAKQTFNGTATNVAAEFTNAVETTSIGSALSASNNLDLSSATVYLYTSNAANNWTLNFRSDTSNSLDSVMNIGETISVAVKVTMGATPYYNTAVTIDGGAITAKWLGGAPTFGVASSRNNYLYSITKTGAATFIVDASLGVYS